MHSDAFLISGDRGGKEVAGGEKKGLAGSKISESCLIELEKKGFHRARQRGATAKGGAKGGSRGVLKETRALDFVGSEKGDF